MGAGVDRDCRGVRREPFDGLHATSEPLSYGVAGALLMQRHRTRYHASPETRANRESNSGVEENDMWILLLLPFIGLLWLPFYNESLPTLFGFPFFYWYQLLWVPLTALLIWIVYRSNKKKGDAS
jgi:Protein of unknown function (DUF3311)